MSLLDAQAYFMRLIEAYKWADDRWTEVLKAKEPDHIEQRAIDTVRSEALRLADFLLSHPGETFTVPGGTLSQSVSTLGDIVTMMEWFINAKDQPMGNTYQMHTASFTSDDYGPDVWTGEQLIGD